MVKRATKKQRGQHTRSVKKMIVAGLEGKNVTYIVSISTYGCIKSSENRYYFKEGLKAMMDYLKPEVVLIHGKMPNDIFVEYLDKAQFISYPSYYEMRNK